MKLVDLPVLHVFRELIRIDSVRSIVRSARVDQRIIISVSLFAVLALLENSRILPVVKTARTVKLEDFSHQMALLLVFYALKENILRLLEAAPVFSAMPVIILP